MKKEHKKKLLSRVLKELEGLLYKAIDSEKDGNLNVFEMIMVSADTLDRNYKERKKSKPVTTNNVVAFKRKENENGKSQV